MCAAQAPVAWATWHSAWCMARNWTEALGSVALPRPTDLGLMMKEKLKRTIRVFALGIAIASAVLYTTDSATGIYMSKSVERHLGQKLLTLADNPKMYELTVKEFFSDFPPPRTLHKEIFCTRQIMHRLVCDSAVFLFSVLIVYMMRERKQ